MTRLSAKLLSALIAAFPVLPTWADVSVRFEPEKEYTDLALSGASTPTVQEELLKLLEQHFKQLGKQYLSEDDRLEIVVKDIDMAGAFEPWRTPNMTNTRFIRDIYFPKVVLHFRWLDQTGKLKSEERETVSDLNYLMMLNSRRYNSNDPLRYEKAMLDRWFEKRFGDGYPAKS